MAHSYSDPVFAVAVVGFLDEIELLFQFGDALRLTFHGDGVKLVDVEIAEHVPFDVEHEHVLRSVKLCKWCLLFDAVGKRKAIIAQILDIHDQ